ncbi:hypothetical protein Skr01_42120 [Sphaerisporangium krabiense]|uniref:Uncharacterized protein n=1 Tax=Sphaerisporangium krabiense TaxID=763782 RepID=A0A7W9DNI1_9ACTN|nr:hypothetical protein [Sphaerisporangium krabiense]MBB5625358.1 hypothetical protein [Sphaerisporangium krabiense]GII64127.1 hypothetical protein Skr01_42120 [Sphaerisporangium krabiense]
MGEFVGVDPANLRELAVRLQRLHAVLARYGPAMQQKMQKWGSGLDYTALPRLLDEALNDARDMEARTTRAFDLAARAAGGADAPPHHAPAAGATVELDWTASGHSAHQAGHDAATLDAALAAGPERADTRTHPVRESLVRHLNDGSYLGAFWAGACPLALRAARSLARRAGAAMFSAESAGILRALGASLASATQMRKGTGKDRRPLMSDETRAAIIGHDDLWSVAMLFKYGPRGNAWDSRFLAEMVRAVLDARAAGALDVPLPEPTEDNAARLARRRAEFDPVVAVLGRASENGQAARHVLGCPVTGPSYAAMLVDDGWRAPGEGPDLGGPVGDFLTAAVSAGRGVTEDAKESAWSVVTIVRAASEFGDRRPGAALPDGVRAALAFTADRYLPDLAAPGPGNEARPPAGSPPGSWTPHVAEADLTRFVHHAFPDPRDAAAFLARVAEHRTGRGPDPGIVGG